LEISFQGLATLAAAGHSLSGRGRCSRSSALAAGWTKRVRRSKNG